MKLRFYGFIILRTKPLKNVFRIRYPIKEVDITQHKVNKISEYENQREFTAVQVDWQLLSGSVNVILLPPNSQCRWWFE